ncbi:MAG: helix-turn-helix domain-containing protein [Caldilineaceae bacterium]
MALRLFATNGLAGTKVADIAAAAEMSHGLLYHYYRAKEDIYVELIRHAFREHEQRGFGLGSVAPAVT